MPLQTTGSGGGSVGTGKFGSVSSIYHNIDRIQRDTLVTQQNERERTSTTEQNENEEEDENFIVNPKKIEELEIEEISNRKFKFDFLQTILIFFIILIFFLPGLISIITGLIILKKKLIFGLILNSIGIFLILISILFSCFIVILRRSKFGNEYFYIHLAKRKRIKSELNL